MRYINSACLLDIMAALISKRQPKLDISEFVAGSTEKQYQYSSFLPSEINHAWVASDAAVANLLAETSRVLGELNAYSELVPDVDFFIRMHVMKEATSSSQIEGTQTNIDEALISEADVNPEKRDDWAEVQNYVTAMNSAIADLDQLPLSNRLLRNAHATLMQGVRGKKKAPGEYRLSQNWIGVSLKNAVFVPPHHDHIPRLMGDLELFMHNEEVQVPHLLKIAILHYQFETIHPFLDGNGRLGRLMIALYLFNFKLLSKPSLYLSAYLEKNKTEYYDLLTAVRQNNNITEWIKFFLTGVEETALNSIIVFKAIIALRQRLEQTVMFNLHARKRGNGLKLLSLLYGYPAVHVTNIADILKIQHSTASTLVADFERLKILKQYGEAKRNRVYIFDEYVQLFR